MSFNWAEYLDLAYELEDIPVAQPAGREAHQRAALSRAYYAVYHTALTIAKSKDQYVEPGGVSVHQHLIAHFTRSSDPLRQNIAVDLRRLLGYRREADYNNFIPPVLLAQRSVIGLQLATHLLAKPARL